MTGMDVSVVVPAYNEAKRLPGSLSRVLSYLDGHCRDRAEVIVVDDGSTDDTASLVERVVSCDSRVRLLRNGRNRGKGFSIRRGVLASRGDLVLTTDADLSAPIEEFEKLYFAIRDGADIAVGSRAIEGAQIELRQPAVRRTLGRLFNLIVRTLVVPGIADTQCGFKLFRRSAALEVYGRCQLDGFATDVEALYIARRLGITVKEIPVRWRHAEGSTVRPLRDGLRMCADVLAMAWRTRDPRTVGVVSGERGTEI